MILREQEEGRYGIAEEGAVAPWRQINIYNTRCRFSHFEFLQPTIAPSLQHFHRFRFTLPATSAFFEMPNSNFDRGRILPLFRLPTNIPASMDYQRDRRNRRWWASPNHNVFLAAGIMLTVLALIVIVTSYFFASGPLATLLLSGHKDGSRAMATNMHERRFKSWKDRFRKQRGYRHPVKTCIGLFIFFFLVIVFTI